MRQDLEDVFIYIVKREHWRADYVKVNDNDMNDKKCMKITTLTHLDYHFVNDKPGS